MPSKTDTMKLGSPFLSRRAKLLPCQREMVKFWHEMGTVSIRTIAKIFKVDRRLIQFILFPERKEKNLQDRTARGGSKQYYDKNYNIKGCTEKPTTICVHEKATFGMCEKHFKEGKEKGNMKLQLEF